MNYDRQSKCPCKNGPKCDYCSYCLGCSCRCHSWFTVHTRLFPLEQEKKLLKSVKETAKAGAVGLGASTLSLALERLQHAKGDLDPPPPLDEDSQRADNHGDAGESGLDRSALVQLNVPEGEEEQQQADSAVAQHQSDQPVKVEEFAEASLEIVI